jgi:hypothetical protein
MFRRVHAVAAAKVVYELESAVLEIPTPGMARVSQLVLLQMQKRFLDQVLLDRGVVCDAVDDAFGQVANFRLMNQHSDPLAANRPESFGQTGVLQHEVPRPVPSIEMFIPRLVACPPLGGSLGLPGRNRDWALEVVVGEAGGAAALVGVRGDEIDGVSEGVAAAGLDIQTGLDPVGPFAAVEINVAGGEAGRGAGAIKTYREICGSLKQRG